MDEPRSEFFDLGGPIPLDVMTCAPYPRATVKALGEAIRWRMDPAAIHGNHFRQVTERARIAVARMCELPASWISFPEAADAAALQVPRGARILHPPRVSPRLHRILETLRQSGALLETLRSDEGDADGGTLASILASRHDGFVALDWVRPGDGVARNLAHVTQEAAENLRFIVEGSGAFGRLPFPPGLRSRFVFLSRSGGSLLAAPGLWVQISPDSPPVESLEEPPDLLLAALTASATLLWEFGLGEIGSRIAEYQAALLPRLSESGLVPLGVFEPTAPRPTLLLRRADGGPIPPLIEHLRQSGFACGIDGSHLRLAFHVHNERAHVENLVCALKGAHIPS